jgi:hypothetical protein
MDIKVAKKAILEGIEERSQPPPREFSFTKRKKSNFSLYFPFSHLDKQFEVNLSHRIQEN